MTTFKFPKGEQLDISDIEYKVELFDKYSKELATSKSKLDLLYNNPKFRQAWSQMDYFKLEKRLIGDIVLTQSIIKNKGNGVSNAWLKCYEMINRFKIIKRLNAKFGDKINYFDNAAFPGSFIVSTKYAFDLYNSVNKDNKIALDWHASSLLVPNAEDAEPLSDEYNLMANYPDKWIMCEEMNGDVIKKENILWMMNKFKNSIHLYTSDLGFDVSEDYNNQEMLHLKANIGQILCGILCMAKGGIFITKQYTILSPTTISIMYAISTMFKKFCIYKPITSRAANSETYVVGIGFRGVDLNNIYIKELFKYTNNERDINIPLFKFEQYPEEFVKAIKKTNKSLTHSQIEKIENDLNRIDLILKEAGNRYINAKFSKTLSNFLNEIDSIVLDWYKKNPILCIE